MKLSIFVGLGLFVGIVARGADAPRESGATAAGELVSFSRGDATLHGWLCKPQGTGPFPAMIFNHGSEKTPGSFPPLAAFWTSKGYVFFVPHRSGHGRSEGEYIVDLQKQFREKEKDAALCQKQDIELHERANLDVVAAVAWLKEQPIVDKNRLVMSGGSYGGIQTLLSAEKNLGVKAYVPFAAAAMSWQGNPLLRQRLAQCVKNGKAPIFFLQAQNDYDLGPSELLGEELKSKGGLNRAKVYPPFGDPKEHKDGHGGFIVRASEVWGADVLGFVNEAFK